jgi:hypothetical protein
MNYITLILLLVYSNHLKNQEFSIYERIPNPIEVEKSAFLTLVMIMKVRQWD